MKQGRRRMALLVVIALLVTLAVPMSAMAASEIPNDLKIDAVSVDEGIPATFTVESEGGALPAGLTFQWQVKKGENAAFENVTDGKGDNTASYTTPATTADMNGWEYQCIVSNGIEEATPNPTAKLTVTPNEVPSNEKPQVEVTSEPEDGTQVVDGASVTLTAEITMNPESSRSIQWYVIKQDETGKDLAAEAVSGATGEELVLDPVTAEMNGWKYYCVVINTGYSDPLEGSSKESPITLNVRAKDGRIEIVSNPKSAEVLEGENVMFTIDAAAENGAALSYEWQRSATEKGTYRKVAGSQNAPELTISNVTSDYAGYYRCVVTSGSGEESKTATSAVAQLTVNERSADPTVTPKYETTTTVFEGDPVTLEVEAEITNGDAIAYQWEVKIGGTGSWTPIVGANSAAYTIAADDVQNGNQYRCVVTNADDAEANKAGEDNTVTTLSLQHRELIPEIVAQPENVTVKQGDEANLKLEIQIAPVEEGSTAVYEVQAQRWDPTKTDDTGWINISTARTVDATTNADGKILVNIGTSYFNNWLGTYGTGSYRFQVTTKTSGTETTANGESILSDVAYVTYKRDHYPQITAQPQNTTVSVGGSATFSVEATVEPAARLSYQWYKGSEPIKDATEASYTVKDAAVEMDGAKYYCVVQNDQYKVTTKSYCAVLTVSDEAPVVIPGDVDGNGEITATDLAQLAQALIGERELTGASAEAADMNGDGAITPTDLAQLAQALIA
ncbi:immunoglobulin domain-containing protein [Christensenella massiliensis]|uniref:Immunoglobulin domain-containing protein n=1 Tax=Christensenella massiliensis TaxID=1805714 RepID=A0AAU8A547_9FIRM